MLRPDPEDNPRGDAAWFGILTWIQPRKEVKDGDTQQVFISLLSTMHWLTLRHTQCEVWWVYTKQHLIDVVKGVKAKKKNGCASFMS